MAATRVSQNYVSLKSTLCASPSSRLSSFARGPRSSKVSSNATLSYGCLFSRNGGAVEQSAHGQARAVDLHETQQQFTTVSGAASRRATLLSLGSFGAAALVSALTPIPSEASQLPKAYTELVQELVDTLRESINLEATGATEFEVRRAGDPAKAKVQEYVGKWIANPQVAQDPVNLELQTAIRTLGDFYQKNGQRAALTDDVRYRVLEHLNAVQKGLSKAEDFVPNKQATISSSLEPRFKLPLA